MALSGSVTKKGIVDNDRIYLRFEWSAEQDVAENVSTVSWGMYLVSDGSQWGWITSVTQDKWNVTVNGEDYEGTANVGLSVGETKLLASGTTEVPHNADGTKTFSFTFKQYFNIKWSDVLLGTHGGSGSGTLDTIPRASTPSVSGAAQLGSEITIATNRASGSFTHNLTWKWAGAEGLIANGVGASCVWTPSITDFAPLLTDATSAKCTVTCRTYSGSTLVGTKSCEFQLAIPASVAPSISKVACSDPSGLLQAYGAFVQGRSEVMADITAAGAYGSSIVSALYSVDGAGSALDGESAGAPTKSGTRTVTATVRDSRGRTASKSVTIAVAAYSAPSVSTAEAVRVKDGAEDDESTTVRVTYAGTFRNVNGKALNARNIRILYKPRSASAWTAKAVSNASYSPSGYLDVEGVPTDAVYDFCVEFADSFIVTPVYLVVGTAEPLMEWFRNEGVGFGWVPTAAGFFVNMDAVFKKNFTLGGTSLSEAQLISLLGCPYAVGDILHTTNAADPAERWPGTKWMAVKDKFLLGAGSLHFVGESGGEEFHTLTVNEIPSHGHLLAYVDGTEASYFGAFSAVSESFIGTAGMYNNVSSGWEGGNQAHNNMPPYYTVYIWRRTA